jgi:protein HOOK3
MRQPESQSEGFSERFNTSVQLAKANSAQRYVNLGCRAYQALISDSDEYWKLYENYTSTLKKIAEVQDTLETTKKDLSEAQTQRTKTIQEHIIRESANSCLVGLVDMEKAEMLRELEEYNSGELAKLRGDWNNLAQNVHHLEAEVDASQTLVREVCSEREELRKMLDNKQNEISAEDQEVMNEMQMLLGEFETHNSYGGDRPQKSSFELLKQCAGVLEKNVERLAQRAEVCFNPQGFVRDRMLTSMVLQYIQQQNELIKSLRESMKNYEENLDDGIPKEREVSIFDMVRYSISPY